MKTHPALFPRLIISTNSLTVNIVFGVYNSLPRWQSQPPEVRIRNPSATSKFPLAGQNMCPLRAYPLGGSCSRSLRPSSPCGMDKASGFNDWLGSVAPAEPARISSGTLAYFRRNLTHLVWLYEKFESGRISLKLHCKKRILNSGAANVKSLIWKQISPVIH